MPRASIRVPLWLSGALLAAAVLVLGCARQGEAPRGPSAERSGARGALRYQLRTQIEPARVTLGDRAVWRLTAQLSGAGRPGSLLRDPTDSSLDIVPLGAPSAVRREGGTRWSASFEARGFDIGRVPLPRASLTALVAGAVDTLEFPPDTLYVDSLTPAMTGAVAPDRGPLRTELRPIDYAVAFAAALLAVGAIVAAVWLFRRFRRRARGADAETAPESPEAIFLRSIEGLRAEIGSLPRDQFYERLSFAIRVYVAAVTGLPALDRTTAELERELLDRGFDRGAVDAVGAMLRRSDLAKFARHEDPPAEARAALEGASALVGRLNSLKVEPPPAAAAPAGTEA